MAFRITVRILRETRILNFSKVAKTWQIRCSGPFCSSGDFSGSTAYYSQRKRRRGAAGRYHNNFFYPEAPSRPRIRAKKVRPLFSQFRPFFPFFLFLGKANLPLWLSLLNIQVEKREAAEMKPE